jgi:hypothetical protein
MKSNLPKKSTGTKKITAKLIVDDALDQICNGLSIKLPDSKLKIVRDQVISQYHRNWKRNSAMAKAFRYHFRAADIDSSDIQYHHLLMAELIRTFSIANEEEYLLKCQEFRILPYEDRTGKIKESTKGKLSKEEIVDRIQIAFRKMRSVINAQVQDEVENALSQDYPICSFEELAKKSRLN